MYDGDTQHNRTSLTTSIVKELLPEFHKKFQSAKEIIAFASGQDEQGIQQELQSKYDKTFNAMCFLGKNSCHPDKKETKER